MKRFSGLMVVVVSVLVSGPVRADEKDPTPILEKAIEALGGEAKLAKAATAMWKSKGTIAINDNDVPVKQTMTVDGLDRQRAEFDLEVNGEPFKGVAILNGSKGWRKFGDNLMDLDDEGLASVKQGTYLMAASMTVLPLKGKGFKVELAPEEKVGGKPVDVVKGTGPDGKSFTLAFDKETHLPLRMVATVKGFQGEDYLQEMTYSDYKDFGGIKRATKAEGKRDGNPFSKQEITEFKVIDKPDPSQFDEPK